MSEKKQRDWRRWQLAIYVIPLILGGGIMTYDNIRASTALYVLWHQGSIRLTCPTDGPFIVTHLATANPPESRVVASLLHPVAIFSESGAWINKEEVNKLTWIDFNGQVVAGPKDGSDIVAFYYKPKVTSSSEWWLRKGRR